ncbi:hypothetical protein SUGI_0489350 [Cryptomeria japonica]|nr:hypothetical protein SUGI_0489350 [Cryptomeria japonica]
MIQENFWQPKPSSKATKVFEVNPNIVYSQVVSVEIDNEEWYESIHFLKDKALFLKWRGAWPTYSKICSWCNEHWGEGVELKMFENGFYLVIFPTTLDRDWILENGPFFVEGKGFIIISWKPNFNTHEELINIVLIWLKLPGLPQEYTDLETLRRIGNNLDEFVMREEVIDASDFIIFSRLCINWQLIHNLLDTIEIKSGSGIWKQKIILEEAMESCTKCKVITHSTGSCKDVDKGKQVMQN